MGEVRIKSGNLFDTSVYNNNAYLHNCNVTNTSNSVTITSTGTDPFVGFVNSLGTTVPERAQSMYIPVKPNTAYTIDMSSAPKCYCAQVDNSNVIKRGTQINLLPYRFTTGDSTAYVIIRLGDDTLQTGDSLTFENIQLLEGTYTSETIPEYQPYFLNRPAHQYTNGQWVDIPTHHYTNGRWQGELTSQSPLKFRADGEMLDWRIEGRTSGNLWDGTFINTSGWGVSFSLDDEGYMVGSSSSNDPREWGYAASQIKMTLGAGTYALVLQGIPPTQSWSGAMIYTSGGSALANNQNLVNKPLIIMPFTLTQETSIGIIVKVVNGKYRVQLLEGTYTSSTIPPYEPYGGGGTWDETTQRYKIPVTVEGENLFDIGTSATDYTSPSYTNLTISNDTLSMKLSSESGMTYAVRKQQQTQKGAVTFALDTDCNTGIGIIVRIRDNDDTRWLTSSDTSISGFTYNNVYGGWYKWTPLNNGHPIQAITIPNVGSYYYVGILFAHSSSAVGNVYSATNIRLLEGTYTAETVPPYEPYINTTTNLYTDHQLMDGDSIDYATDQTAIPIATGNNTLTVDTAVQPSKVFVKFEG